MSPRQSLALCYFDLSPTALSFSPLSPFLLLDILSLLFQATCPLKTSNFDFITYEAYFFSVLCLEILPGNKLSSLHILLHLFLFSQVSLCCFKNFKLLLHIFYLIFQLFKVRECFLFHHGPEQNFLMVQVDGYQFLI